MDYRVGDEFFVQTIGDSYYTRIINCYSDDRYDILDLDTMLPRKVIGKHELTTNGERTVRYLGYKNTKLGKIMYGSK